MPARLCSKSFKLGFSSMWTKNFLMHKLNLEKVEEPERKAAEESNSQHILDHWKNKEIPPPKIEFCFIDYAKSFDCIDHNKLWNILNEMGIQDHITCLLRNMCTGQEATVRTGQGTMDWFQIGKWVPQGCILSPHLFNLHAEYIIWNARLDES